MRSLKLKKMKTTNKVKLNFLPILMGLGFSFMYIHFMIYVTFDPFKFTMITFAKIIFVATVYNIGFILISFGSAKKYKKITTLLFIPSVTITPFIAGLYFIPAFFIILIVNLYVFVKLNPWKKNEKESNCTFL